jgi:hypothetical protein
MQSFGNSATCAKKPQLFTFLLRRFSYVVGLTLYHYTLIN